MSRESVTIIVTLLVATFVVILNETIMNVALQRLMVGLGVGAPTVQWLSTGFMLTMAVVIPTTGFILQRLSTRAVFLLAMGLFSGGTLLAAVAPRFRAFGRWAKAMNPLMYGPNYGHDDMVSWYNRHNAEVRATVPPGRLLDFQVQQGWEPLCEFLRVPVPDSPFPKVNSREEMQTRMAQPIDSADMRELVRQHLREAEQKR
jgi:hypothetical protein